MRVVHLPYTYYPEPVGGTEIYVQALVQELDQLNYEGIIAAPAAEAAVYVHDGIEVHRLAVSAAGLGLRDLYGEGDSAFAVQFAQLLDDEHVDVVHLHAFTSAISLRLVREAARRGVPVVFTYHAPTVSCKRGTLLRMGRTVCDGRLERRRCTRCTLDGLGLNSAASWAIGLLPPAIVQHLGAMRWEGNLWTALRMGELISVHHNAIRALWNEVDSIIVLCAWVQDLLIRNGAPSAKTAISRHGLMRRGQSRTSSRSEVGSGHSLRLAYLGRLHPTKGVDLLVRALRSLPGVAIKLDLYGIVQGAECNQYLARLANLAANDGRIRFLEPVPIENVQGTLSNYDLLCVPSQCMETGPLVVLEAFNAGVPVLGSALGGIAELVEHGVDGLLVQPYNEMQAWTAALQALIAEPGLVRRLAASVTPPRGMEDVAEEMLTVYSKLVADSRGSRE